MLKGSVGAKRLKGRRGYKGLKRSKLKDLKRPMGSKRSKWYVAKVVRDFFLGTKGVYGGL